MSLLAYGGQVTAIGLLTVFTALLLLILSIYIMSSIFKAVNGKKAAVLVMRKPGTED